MKKVLLIISILLIPMVCKAVNIAVFLSSYTATSESAAQIQNGSNKARYLYSVIVGSATTGGYLLLYDRQASTATNQIANINLGTIGDYSFCVNLSSGLVYNTVGNSNGVTIIYK